MAIARHPCPSCTYVAGRKDHLVRHARTQHTCDRPYACPQCPQAYARSDHLRRHVLAVHENARKHACPHCDRTFCRSDKLREHLEHVHDLGNSQCDTCMGMRHTSIPYDGIHLCRQCFRKATGANSRVELHWSRFLDEHFGKHYLMGSDVSLQAMGGCSRVRPDKLWGSVVIGATGSFAICGELDESWHRDKARSCEEARMSEIAEAVGGKVVFVRLNPHLKGPSMHDRFQAYLEVLQGLCNDPPEHLVSVIYMYYPSHAHNVATRWPVTRLHEI